MSASAVLSEPEFQLFYDYWDELRGTALVPAKAEFDPLRVSSLMSIMSVIQWTPPDQLLLRLMGTTIVDQTHVETTGTNLMDIILQSQRDAVAELSAAVFRQPAISLVSTYRCFESGRKVGVKFAFFPFFADDGALNTAIGVHKADLEANKLVSPEDPLLHAELLSYEYMDIGNGVPNIRYPTEA